MLITTNIFYHSVPKLGNTKNENEDAIGVIRSPKKGEKFHELRCVIADGATQSSFSRLWANLLVSNAIKSGKVPSEKNLLEVIGLSSPEWEDQISQKELPWYAVEKAHKGAFSSFLWLSLKNNSSFSSSSGRIKVIAVGDSEFFLIRRNEKLVAFPVELSTSFGSNPTLVSSKPQRNEGLIYGTWEVNWEPGDEVLLATDAIAQYLLNQFEKDENPLTNLRDLFFHGEHGLHYFEEWINSLRKIKEIKNDDSSLIWIQLMEMKDYQSMME